MIHASVDIEALGTTPGSVVLAIGAVAFDPHGNYVKTDSAFHQNIDVASSLRHGFGIDGDTFYWWWGRDSRARKAIIEPTPDYASAVLIWFDDWYHTHRCEAVWSHRFDMNLLGAYFSKLRLPSPWGYRNELDIRTLFNTAAKFGYKKEQTRDKDKHHPVYDATRQAKEIQTAYEYIMKGEQP